MQEATREGPVRWWVEGRARGLLASLIRDPDAVLCSAASVPRARVGRKRFYRVEGSSGEAALYVKVFAAGSWLTRLASVARRSKARREAVVARELRARGFEVAAPVAVGEERHARWLRRSFSVIPERPGRDLRALLLDSALAPRARRGLVGAFADFARRLHDAGVDQDDFSPNNFLVAADGSFCLLDLERCRLRAPLGRRRWRLLAKLHRHELGVSRTERLRFLTRYLGSSAGRGQRRAAWTKIGREFRRIRRRDARRAARAAFRVGRHVGREGDVWFVRGRERAAVLRLELPPRAARRAWITAHQLERLALPALRPVRLGGDWIELELPAGQRQTPDAGAIARSRRRLEAHGRFTGSESWLEAGGGAAVLSDPTGFQLLGRTPYPGAAK